jgi:hypothetical protein
MSPEDRAQALELREWESNNERASSGKAVRYQPGDAGYGPEFCVIGSCGEELPAERRTWGFNICVECKARMERAGRNGRH